MAKTERRSACCLLLVACLLLACCLLDLRGEGCSNICSAQIVHKVCVKEYKSENTGVLKNLVIEGFVQSGNKVNHRWELLKDG